MIDLGDSSDGMKQEIELEKNERIIGVTYQLLQKQAKITNLQFYVGRMVGDDKRPESPLKEDHEPLY